MKQFIKVSFSLLLVMQMPLAMARWHDVCDNCGTVRDVDRVQVRDRDRHFGAGTVIGAIAGGVLGSTLGKGDGRTAATVGGAVVGGAVGHNVEKNDRRGSYVAWRYRIKMDDGQWVLITKSHRLDIQRGDRVRVEGNDIESM